MKLIKQQRLYTALIGAALALAAVPVFAEESGAGEAVVAEVNADASAVEERKDSRLETSISFGAAWYPEVQHTTASGTHFMPLCGAYDGAEAAIKGAVSYTMPFLQADNMLMEDNSLTLEAALQVSPVTVTPSLSVTVSPLAVLELSVGGEAGSGWSWDFFNFQGAGEYSLEKQKYVGFSPFEHWYLHGWASATLMFDTGAIWEGDWTHVVMVATYEVGYQKMTGTSNVWQWKSSSYPMANGWIYRQEYFLGYQMPLPLSIVGVDVELSGHYSASDFAVSGIDESYDGDFMRIDISLVAQYKLDKAGKNAIGMYACVSSRRSFAEEWKDWDTEPLLTKNGREFFFESVGVEWKHIF